MSEKKIVFSICTGSYRKLAEAALINFSFHMDEFKPVLLVVDDGEAEINKVEKFNAEDLDPDYGARIKQYDVTEYCTYLKPIGFKKMFSSGAQEVVYIDPDIYVMQPIPYLTDTIPDSYLCYLTPHIIGNSVGNRSFKDISATGVFNLGYAHFKKSALTLDYLNWWCLRLQNDCYNEPLDATYTDQKWCNFAPVYFREKLNVIDDSGCNIGPWNLHERQFDSAIFLHFSGVNYQQLIDGDPSEIAKQIEVGWPEKVLLQYRRFLVDNNVLVGKQHIFTGSTDLQRRWLREDIRDYQPTDQVLNSGIKKFIWRFYMLFMKSLYHVIGPKLFQKLLKTLRYLSRFELYADRFR